MAHADFLTRESILKVQEQDIYHGIALAQIVRHESFKALNSASEKQGHYMVNSDRHLLVKYRTTEGPSWVFTFRPEEISALRAMSQKSQLVYLCLVCGYETVCALDFEEIKILLSPKAAEQQSITVDAPPNASLRVRGTLGELDKTVPHNAFPKKIFFA